MSENLVSSDKYASFGQKISFSDISKTTIENYSKELARQREVTNSILEGIKNDRLKEFYEELKNKTPEQFLEFVYDKIKQYEETIEMIKKYQKQIEAFSAIRQVIIDTEPFEIGSDDDEL